MNQYETERSFCEILSDICQNAVDSIRKKKGYQTAKTFFVSEAYAFLEELIHLHSVEIRNIIKNVLRELQRESRA